MSLYAGMGSFNDIVLHRNGMPDINGSNKLDELRHSLFLELTKNYK